MTIMKTIVIAVLGALFLSSQRLLLLRAHVAAAAESGTADSLHQQQQPTENLDNSLDGSSAEQLVSEHGMADDRSSARDYGGGGGGGYGGGGGGGCPMCPYQQPCDSGTDALLYFGAGALLGLLFSMMQSNSASSMMSMAPAMMMMTPMPPPPPPPPMMVKRTSSSLNSKSMDANLLQQHKGASSSGTLPTSVMTVIANDVAPLAADLVSIYAKGQQRPECARRLLCDLIKSFDHSSTNTANGQHDDDGGGESLTARLTSLSSEVLGWLLLKDVQLEHGILDHLMTTIDGGLPSSSSDVTGAAGPSRRRLVDCASLSPSDNVGCDDLSSMYAHIRSRRSRSKAVPGYND